MAFRFATVSDDDILATNEAAIPTNNNTKYLQQNRENALDISPKHCQLKLKESSY